MKALTSIALLAALTSSQAIAAEYAIVCKGIEQTTNSIPAAGSLGIKSGPLRQAQTYVIDEERNTIRKALPPMRKFEDVCSLAGASQTVTISTKYALADSSIVIVRPPAQTCHFLYDRVTRHAEWSIRGENDLGQFHEWKWIMKCQTGPVPVFSRFQGGS